MKLVVSVLSLLTLLSVARSQNIGDRRVLVMGKANSRCLKQKDPECFDAIAHESISYLEGTKEVRGRALSASCAKCMFLTKNRYICLFYNNCNTKTRRNLHWSYSYNYYYRHNYYWRDYDYDSSNYDYWQSENNEPGITQADATQSTEEQPVVTDATQSTEEAVTNPTQPAEEPLTDPAEPAQEPVTQPAQEETNIGGDLSVTEPNAETTSDVAYNAFEKEYSPKEAEDELVEDPCWVNVAITEDAAFQDLIEAELGVEFSEVSWLQFEIQEKVC